MTDEKLAEIEQRANASTPGPWWAAQDPEFGPAFSDWDDWAVYKPPETRDPKEAVALAELDNDPNGKADAAFIAAARSDIPALVSEVRRLRAALAIAIDDGNLPKSVRADIDAALRGES